MLSRVADNLYWLARYMERAENTARLVSVNANLMLDLPRGISPGWKPLVDITGGREAFEAGGHAYDERNVVRFLVGEASNPSSIVACVANSREIARTVRDMVPREIWEHLNGLHLYSREHLSAGLTKRGRFDYLRHIILGTQTLTGILEGTMSIGPGYRFLCAGRYLERADMTSRIVDVRSAGLLPGETEGLRPYENIQWMSVLKSLTAYQMYRLARRVRVNRVDVLEFLLRDAAFPRAFYACVCRAEQHLGELAGSKPALRALGRLNRILQGAKLADMTPEELHELIDLLQLGLGAVHNEIAGAFFAPAPAANTSA